MVEKKYIAIDIGGTSTRIACSVSLDVPRLEEKTVFATTTNFKSDYQKITEYIDARTPIHAIGISIPGNLNADKTLVSHANNVPGYINQPLSALLSEKYEAKVHMDNDASVAALGEAYYGTSTKEDFSYVIWGTGIGGASVIFDRDKATSNTLDWDTYFQTWEEACGGKSLQKKYAKPAEQLTEEEWQEVMKQFSDELEKFRAKVPTKRIILGGGIAIKQAARLKHLPGVEVSTLGEDAGLYGAFGLLKEI